MTTLDHSILSYLITCIIWDYKCKGSYSTKTPGSHHLEVSEDLDFNIYILMTLLPSVCIDLNMITIYYMVFGDLLYFWIILISNFIITWGVYSKEASGDLTFITMTLDFNLYVIITYCLLKSINSIMDLNFMQVSADLPSILCFLKLRSITLCTMQVSGDLTCITSTSLTSDFSLYITFPLVINYITDLCIINPIVMFF